jgi:capsular exopolysaccharide synthesis family protein
VLIAGPIPPAPSELLGSKRFLDLLESLKGEFDFIFIDAPPILMVTDAVLIVQAADGVVFIVRAGVTRMPFVRRAFEFLAGSRNKVLGIVLNAMDVRSAEYKTTYGYYGDQKYYGDKDE